MKISLQVCLELSPAFLASIAMLAKFLGIAA